MNADDSTPKAAPTMRTYASDVAALTGKPLPKNVKNTPVPPAPPVEAPPAVIIPKAPTTNESKEAVLARLRLKAESHTPPPPEPTPFAPLPHAPSTTESRDQVLKRLRQNTAPATSEVAAAPPRVHTYKSDFSEHATESGASRISMVAAQADAVRAPVVLTQKKRTNTVAFIAGGMLVIAGLGAVYAAYRFAVGEPPIPVETYVPSLIFADERVRLEGSAEDLRTQLASGAGLSLSEGDVAVAYLSFSTTTKEQGTIEIVASGKELIEALALPAPAVLLRAIEPQSMAGLAHVGDATHPFFILRVDSYERSFAGMLEWEPTMERDLSLFYPPHPVLVVEPPPTISTTTEASTTPVVAPPPFRLSFVDEVIGNRDVRVLKDADGRVVMLYGYRDKETLLLARSPEAFLELLERLSSGAER